MEASTHDSEMAKPRPKDMSHHYSDVTSHRFPSQLKGLYKYFTPEIGNFAGGLPNARFFPFDTLEAQAAKPERWTPTPNHPGAEGDVASLTQPASALSLSSRKNNSSKSDPRASSQHIVVPHDERAGSAPTRKIDLATALQYGQANGYPPLLSFLRQFARTVLHPAVPYAGGPDVILTNGNTDGMSKTLDLFTNIWVEGKDDARDRPGMLVEVFMYTSVQGQAGPRGVAFVPVEMDDEGMRADGPGGLEDVLATWDYSKGRRPHLMYTVTMGHNPTSGVLGLERRKALYDICSKYDVIIIEDEPYWYLQYPSAAAEEAKARNLPPPPPPRQPDVDTRGGGPSSGYPFIDSLAPSFLNLDVDGRVVRLDTFSKTVAPGCRLGFITATPGLIERFMRINEATTQQPSGFVQAMLAEVVMGPQPEAAKARFAALSSARDRAAFEGWQMDGWVRWLAGLRGEYERRMQRLCATLEAGAFQLKQSTPTSSSSTSKHGNNNNSNNSIDADWGVITKTRLYDFSWPRGGMFIWLRARFETHPLWHAVGSDGKPVSGLTLATGLMVFLTRPPWRVLVAPGVMFGATPEVREARAWAYFRLCFAAESEENVDSCGERFVQGVGRFWRVRRVRELEAILGDDEAEGVEGSGGVGGRGEGEVEVADMRSYMGC